MLPPPGKLEEVVFPVYHMDRGGEALEAARGPLVVGWRGAGGVVRSRGQAQKEPGGAQVAALKSESELVEQFVGAWSEDGDGSAARQDAEASGHVLQPGRRDIGAGAGESFEKGPAALGVGGGTGPVAGGAMGHKVDGVAGVEVAGGEAGGEGDGAVEDETVGIGGVGVVVQVEKEGDLAALFVFAFDDGKAVAVGAGLPVDLADIITGDVVAGSTRSEAGGSAEAAAVEGLAGGAGEDERREGEDPGIHEQGAGERDLALEFLDTDNVLHTQVDGT
jgi:hypothetical protein